VREAVQVVKVEARPSRCIVNEIRCRSRWPPAARSRDLMRCPQGSSQTYWNRSCRKMCTWETRSGGTRCNASMRTCLPTLLRCSHNRQLVPREAEHGGIDRVGTCQQGAIALYQCTTTRVQAPESGSICACVCVCSMRCETYGGGLGTGGIDGGFGAEGGSDGR